MANEEPKFLVDEMLQRLGRWLRAAGYDTVIAQDAESDYYLLRQAIDEGRLLLTRDIELAKHRRAVGTVILLNGDSIDDYAKQLSKELSIDWTHKLFTRCMVCNTLLAHASPEQIATMPEMEKQKKDEAYYCKQCNQVFWDGSHAKRMRTHLSDWQQKYAMR